MKKIIKQTLKTLSRLTQSPQISLLSLVGTHHCSLIASIKQGEFASYSGDKKFNVQKTPLSSIIASKQTETYSGIELKQWGLHFPTYKKNEAGFECLCIPLLGSETQLVSGVIILTQQTNVDLAPARFQFLKMLIPMIASILEEEEEIIESVTKDELTEIYTRSYFDIRLQEEVTRVHRHNETFSIMMIDIDHISKIHQRGGYRSSNSVLQQVAQILHSSIREEIDIPCRYSEHKFIILLPATEVEGAYILGERIRIRCEQHFFGRIEGLQIKATLSMGIAHSNMAATTEETNLPRAPKISTKDIIYRSDIMLQTAQRTGHNQVMVWW